MLPLKEGAYLLINNKHKRGGRKGRITQGNTASKLNWVQKKIKASNRSAQPNPINSGGCGRRAVIN